jgi:cell wall-associated NlpC family hydrolase
MNPSRWLLKKIVLLWSIGILVALLMSCSHPNPPFVYNSQLPAASPAPRDPIADLLQNRPSAEEHPAVPLEKMGYTIQVGAFAAIDNAVHLENLLDARGIDAYYFRHDSGLYKVRFGNHASYGPARDQAERLQKQGLIDTFFIVTPEDYAAARIINSGIGDLRAELVKTVRSFLGTPYRWGGENAENGFDCSGLTMVSYRLNGLNLPRNSRSQFRAGRWVSKRDLRPGDLVFFATKGGTRVTHVGMFIGNGKFIHAPRTGKTVQVENLSNSFFARTYMGGRTYF